MYKPKGRFNTTACLMKPTYREIKGVRTKVYPARGDLIFCSFRSYGGTESNVNGILSVYDTADVETWYRPDIKSDCRIVLYDSGAAYDVLGEPENIDCANQLIKFKVQRVKGGA